MKSFMSQSANSMVIAIKSPFPIEQKQQLAAFMTETDMKKIFNNQQNVQLQKCPSSSISNKKVFRPFCELKVSQYKHKQTGEVVQYIQDSLEVNKLYQNSKLCDFYVENNASEQTMTQLINLFSAKILSQFDPQQFKFLVKPSAYLKSFNSSLQNSDLLVNKFHQQKKQFRSQHINFHQEIPFKTESIPNYILKLKIFPVIKEYIKKRPCWLRNVLDYQLRLDGFKDEYTTSELKNILKYLCYTYRDGPWKHIFCRNGFNPTKEREAALYQILIVKIKRKEVEDYDDKSREESEVENDIYDPSFQQMPTKYLRLYQLCDIEDKRIEQLVKAVSLVSEECNKQTGWFSKHQFYELQKMIKSIREQRSRN